MIQWGRTNYDMFLESIETAGSTASCLKYAPAVPGENPKCLQWSQDSASFTRTDMITYAKTLGTAMETAGYAYLDKYRATVETLAGLKESDTTIEDAADKVEKLRIELERLKIQLQKQTFELEVAKKKTTLDAAELDKKIQDAKVDLEKAKDGNAQQEEIESLRNEIDTAQFNLTTLMKKYDEYKIIANFDGIVTKLDMQVGDSIETNASSSQEQKYIYVETPDLLEVQLDVDQVDIVKIKV